MATTPPIAVRCYQFLIKKGKWRRCRPVAASPVSCPLVECNRQERDIIRKDQHGNNMRKRTSETGEYRRNKRDVTGRPRPEMFVQACAITSREPARRFLDYLMTAAHNMYCTLYTSIRFWSSMYITLSAYRLHPSVPKVVVLYKSDLVQLYMHNRSWP